MTGEGRSTIRQVWLPQNQCITLLTIISITVNIAFSLRRICLEGKNTESCWFSCPVWSKKSKYSAFFDSEASIIDCQKFPIICLVNLAQILCNYGPFIALKCWIKIISMISHFLNVIESRELRFLWLSIFLPIFFSEGLNTTSFYEYCQGEKE